MIYKNDLSFIQKDIEQIKIMNLMQVTRNEIRKMRRVLNLVNHDGFKI